MDASHPERRRKTGTVRIQIPNPGLPSQVTSHNKYLDLKTEYDKIEIRWGRGVAVNMRPCQGRDRRFESGRPRQLKRTTPIEWFFYLRTIFCTLSAIH